jgi:hypothetical protein
MNMQNILSSAHKAWCEASNFRSRRERYKRFTYGDQWCDMVLDDNNKLVREDTMIMETGKKPLTNNLIRQLIKTIVGRYRVMCAEANVYDNSAESYAYRNRLAELDSRLLEEFLISGCAVQRIVNERRMQGCGVWIDNVDPRRFFCNAITDARGWDMELVGMLHDMTLPEVICRFSHGELKRAAEIKHIYGGTVGDRAFAPSAIFGLTSVGSNDFFIASDGKCRVIEVWTLDCKETVTDTPSQPRCEFEFAWHCRWLAPDGTVLDEYDSPYAHRSHPFVVKLYPLTDGEVHPFVEDVIDQQKYINRLIVMIDHIMASSAKGVLLFPTDQLPDGVKWEEVSRCWAHADGVIPITGATNVLPQQVVTQTANTGAYQLLSLQMKLFEDISGVSDALMGKNVSASTGANLYESQVRNATIALNDILESFSSLTSERNAKAEKSVAVKK